MHWKPEYYERQCSCSEQKQVRGICKANCSFIFVNIHEYTQVYYYVD